MERIFGKKERNSSKKKEEHYQRREDEAEKGAQRGAGSTIEFPRQKRIVANKREYLNHKYKRT